MMEQRKPHKRITFRMTNEVHKLLLDAVETSGRSMNAEINIQLLEALQRNTKNKNNTGCSLEDLREVIREELSKNNNSA